jgi:4-amino-4-deoxy-L-arabinose transferase-like glycosyltransferase
LAAFVLYYAERPANDLTHLKMPLVKSISTSQCLALLVAASAFAVLFDLGRSDVVTDNEGQRAAPPAEMLRTGDFIVPRINGVTYLAKPPLLYWATAAIYRISGSIDNVTARLSTSLSSILFAGSAFLLLRRRLGNGVSLLAAIALVTSPYYLGRSRVAELDVPLSWMTFLCIAALWRFCDRAKWDLAGVGLLIFGGTAFGAAILLKGPVPFLFVWPAWVAIQIAEAKQPGFVRIGVKLSIGAFVLECLLKGAAAGVAIYAASHGGSLQTLSDAIGYPYALILLIAVWSWVAWKSSRESFKRNLAAVTLCVGIGILIAAPWAVMVVDKLGWDHLRGLLHNQVVERTYSATGINGGTPFYYLLRLSGMLAPWGLLLPILWSRALWNSSGPAYRMCVATGSISVLVFSFIAGKESEYVLPATPFLLAAIAIQISGLRRREDQTWVVVAYNVWKSVSLFLLGTVAILGPIYLTVIGQPMSLLLTAWAAGIVAIAVLMFGRQISSNRVVSIAIVCVLLTPVGWIAREYKYHGDESFRGIAEVSGKLVRAGHTVESQRMSPYFVYPAFAFYAGTTVPLCVDIKAAATRLSGNDPYFLVVREEMWKLVEGLVPPERRTPLLGPVTYKDVMLVGNRPINQLLIDN